MVKPSVLYGEACTCEFDEKQYNWANLYKIRQDGSSLSHIKTRQPYQASAPHFGNADFPGCDNEIYQRPNACRCFFERIKNSLESDPKGQLPNLMIMALPNDHTSGMTPKFPTPRAMVADNDLAVGSHRRSCDEQPFCGFNRHFYQ